MSQTTVRMARVMEPMQKREAGVLIFLLSGTQEVLDAGDAFGASNPAKVFHPELLWPKELVEDDVELTRVQPD